MSTSRLSTWKPDEQNKDGITKFHGIISLLNMTLSNIYTDGDLFRIFNTFKTLEFQIPTRSSRRHRKSSTSTDFDLRVIWFQRILLLVTKSREKGKTPCFVEMNGLAIGNRGKEISFCNIGAMHEICKMCSDSEMVEFNIFHSFLPF